MAIQLRRGKYADYSPNRLKEGEIAVVKEGDSTVDGKAVYIAFAQGVTKRLATADEMVNYNAEINAIYGEIQTKATNIQQVFQNTVSKANEANQSATNAQEARDEVIDTVNSIKEAIEESGPDSAALVIYTQQAKDAAESATASAESVDSAVTAAQTAKNAAEAANTSAQSAKTAAQTANTNAQSAKTAAETANTNAQSAKTAAETAAEYFRTHGVLSFNTRTGDIVPSNEDYDSSLIAHGNNSTVYNELTTLNSLISPGTGTNSIELGGSVDASGANQTVRGKYNTIDSNSVYADIVGNGTADSARSNAYGLTWDGDIHIALDTTAESGIDHDLYAIIVACGWNTGNQNIIV